MRIVVVLACAVLVLAAGCGGPNSETSSPTSPSPSASAAALSDRQQLQAYVVALLAIVPAVNRAGAITDKTYKAFENDDTATWPAFRKATQRFGNAITVIEARLMAVAPPKALKRAHAQLLKLYGMQ
jgi:hypothetical protein